ADRNTEILVYQYQLCGQHEIAARRRRSSGGIRSAAARAGRGGGAGDHSLPGVAEGVELGLGEVLEEQRADAGEVGSAGGSELLGAGGRQDGVGTAGVVVARLAADESLALEAIGQAGEAR